MANICVLQYFVFLSVFMVHVASVFQVKVIMGEERESTGQLLSIDGSEGVVKFDRGNISMLQLTHLCRLPN